MVTCRDELRIDNSEMKKKQQVTIYHCFEVCRDRLSIFSNARKCLVLVASSNLCVFGVVISNLSRLEHRPLQTLHVVRNAVEKKKRGNE